MSTGSAGGRFVSGKYGVTAGHIAVPHRRYPLWGSLFSLS